MIVESHFRANRWLRGKHLQTTYSTLFRRLPPMEIQRERLELEDGDFVDIDIGPSCSGPVVILLHGLEGSSKSHYMLGMMHALARQNWQSVAMNFRSCSGKMNRLPRFYHSGDTADLDKVVTCVTHNYPGRHVGAVGYSMGGNVLLKYLGEKRGNSPFFAAAAVSVPLLLKDAAIQINQGISKFYQSRFMKLLNEKSRLKGALFKSRSEFSYGPLGSIYEFDDKITAPLHGFSSAEQYYRRSSSYYFLKHIVTPTLILHAADDPFMTQKVIPAAHQLSPHILFELSQKGGHVGFLSGSSPFKPGYYLEQRIPGYLLDHANQL